MGGKEYRGLRIVRGILLLEIVLGVGYRYPDSNIIIRITAF